MCAVDTEFVIPVHVVHVDQSFLLKIINHFEISYSFRYRKLVWRLSGSDHRVWTELCLRLWQSHGAQVFANKIRKYAIDCFPGETPAGGDLRSLLATCTMQSVQRALFGHDPYHFSLPVFRGGVTSGFEGVEAPPKFFKQFGSVPDSDYWLAPQNFINNSCRIC